MREYYKKIPLPVLLIMLLLFLGCGRAVLKQPLPTIPVANAGGDQTVFINLQCELDGGLSTGNLADYQWRAKSIPSGAASPTIDFSTAPKAFFTPTKLGTYEFELELSNVLGISTDEVEINIVPFVAASPEAGFYGVCAHLQSHDGGDRLAGSIAMLADIGAQFVRFDFDWKDIEPADDRFDFSKYDEIVSRLQQEKIEILGILDYGNTWSDPTTGNQQAIDYFADYVYNTVKHFKTKIKHWQIWNEPNNYLFWNASDPGHYYKLLKASYGAVKQANPEAVVVLGGINGNGKDTVKFLGLNINFAKANFLPDLYNYGAKDAKDYFDVVAIHPYTFADKIDSTDNLNTAINDARAIMSANGDGSKRLWITELGPLLFPSGNAPLLVKIFLTEYTEGDVANWLDLVYADLKPKCDKLFWYELRDNPAEFSFSNFDPNWEGLVYADETLKAAFDAYKHLLK